MSTIVSTNIQIGQSSTTQQNFVMYQPGTPYGTIRIKNQSSGVDVLTFTATNAVLPANTVIGSASLNDFVTTSSAGFINATSTSTLTNKTISGADNTIKNNESMTFAVSDESTAITTGTAKITFRAPYAMTLYQLPRASLTTASTSGIPAIDINVNNTSIFSTTLTIDANEKTSTTAATAAVLSTTTIADDAEITVDIDTAGTGAKGLKVTLYYRRT